MINIPMTCYVRHESMLCTRCNVWSTCEERETNPHLGFIWRRTRETSGSHHTTVNQFLNNVGSGHIQRNNLRLLAYKMPYHTIPLLTRRE
ncbi:hypothetical protein AVEN_116642-1 [Araneus ventricosus]|uniref:Uncharacterized protein n=1 Tax=Araneus ventricosus TaxID=182803 RepID=A0A4Y2NW19_ARAVE|nr:hypothetical protein AVEN_116642-1 [Araneus ventricosus]